MQFLLKHKFIISILFSIGLHFLFFLILINFKKEFKIINPPFSESVKITNIQFIKLTPSIQKEEQIKETIEAKKDKPKKIEHKTEHKIQEKITEQKFEPEIIESPKIVLPTKQVLQIQKELEKNQEANDSSAVVAKQIEQEPKKSNSLLDVIKSKPKELEIDSITRSYLKLYGEEFYSFDEKTKEYLISNLNKIGEVTKRYLSYPSISIRTRQSGVAAIEFMLYPNGDIQDLRLLSSSTYSALDQNTIKTIQVAYKDYPKPTKPTKIKIYVNYILR